jgi:hypothetical protein
VARPRFGFINQIRRSQIGAKRCENVRIERHRLKWWGNLNCVFMGDDSTGRA